jgi:Concanavalin A-like lectin/glucanases superfamily
MILKLNNNVLSYGGRILNFVTPSTGTTGNLVTSATLNNATIVAQSPFTGASSGNSYSVTASTTSYLSVSGQTGFAMGTGDYTIEWFQYETDANSFPRIYWYGSSPTLGMSLEGNYYSWANAGATSLAVKGAITNAWHHFALVRISSKLYFYKNGTLISGAGGVSDASNITDTTSSFIIGARIGGLTSEQFGGYITNFRIVKGIGVYTGNFTRPTSVLTAIAVANPYGGSNTAQIPNGYTKLLLTP